MSDDLSHTSSSQGISNEEEFEDFDDELSMSSEVSDLSDTMLATHSKYAIVWELLQNCQEAAVEDIPECHRACLSLFESRHDGQHPVAFESLNSREKYDELFRIAGATQISEAWSLPAVSRFLSDQDALRSSNMQVLKVSEVTPTAAIYITPNTALAKEFQRITDAATSPNATDETILALYNASPMVHAKTPAFASAVFTSASRIAHHEKKPSFHILRRYNRLATTSLLWQAHSFHVDSPVFGVLLQDSLVALHIDWYEEYDGVLRFNSAFFAPVEATDLKTWDLHEPSEAAEVKVILRNLRNHTEGAYAEQILRGLRSVKGPHRPWKWDPSLLPEVLTYSRLQQNIEEPPEEKLNRWRESTAASKDNTSHAAWLRQKLVGGEYQKVEDYHGQRRSFLSPPSTPQSPDDSPPVI